MSNYNVVPNPTGGWDAVKDGAKRASSHHDKQAEAHKAANRYAENSGGGEVRIHGRDGKIRDTTTIGKSDPFPPRG
jgi:hypothetical protein